MRYTLAALFAVLALGAPWLAVNYPEHSNFAFSAIQRAGDELADVLTAFVGTEPKTVADIQGNYDASSSAPQKKVRILIVPGHEPDYGGAIFGSLKERDMTVELGDDLQQFLQSDPHYQVYITRDTQAWSPEFAEYFQNDWDSIMAWEKAADQEESHLIAIGSASVPAATVVHNTVADDVATRLYGITKWADENDIDIEIHIHFNDDPIHPPGVAGDFSGFAIYVPAAQYGNSTTTKAVADAVEARLSKYDPISDLPAESSGLIDDPELIAVGANNTADAASMLIEYAYIYEPQFQNPSTSALAIKDMAYQTYLGLEDFFDPSRATDTAGPYATIALPHTWTSPITVPNSISPDTFALQSALMLDGDYPPAGKTMNDCPRTGKFGPCTREALQSFQDKHGITGEKGIVGTSTIAALNKLYSTIPVQAN